MPWYGYALLSALAIGLVGILQKKTLQYEHTIEYVTVFSLFKLALGLIIFWPAIEWRIPEATLRLLIVNGIVAAAAFYFVAKSLRRLELSTAFPILSLESGLTALLAFFILGERLTGNQLVGLGFMLLGTYVLELRHYPAGWWRGTARAPLRIFTPFVDIAKERGGYFALLGLLFFAVSSVIDRHVLQSVTTPTYLGYMLVVQAMVFIGLAVTTRRRLHLSRGERGYLIWLIAIVAALHLLSNYAQAQAVSLAAVGIVIAIKRLAALFDVIVGGRLFHEHNLVQKTLASIIILVGVYFIIRP